MPNISHDTLFKRLLQSHFTEFLTGFFPEIANELDLENFSEDNFLNQEQLPEINGKVYKLDVVARVKIKHHKHRQHNDKQKHILQDADEDAFVIVFVEAQHTRRKEFLERVFRYFYLLHLKHKTTIIPLVIYSDKAKWRDEKDWTEFKMEFAGLTFVHFQFFTLKLSMKKIKDYLRSTNPAELALAALMDLDKEDLLDSKIELLKRLNQLKISEQEFLNLFQFIDNYLEVDVMNKQKEVNYYREIEEKGEIVSFDNYVKMRIEETLSQGVEQGIEQGQTLAKMNTAAALLKKNMDWDFITDVTSVTEVESK